MRQSQLSKSEVGEIPEKKKSERGSTKFCLPAVPKSLDDSTSMHACMGQRPDGSSKPRRIELKYELPPKAGQTKFCDLSSTKLTTRFKNKQKTNTVLFIGV